MSTQSRTLAVKVFLEGIKVDAVSVNVSGGINTPATARVEIPFAGAAHELLPRTLVHIFYLTDTRQDAAVTPARVSPTDMRSWRLLFAGEVLSYSFQKEGGSRHIALDCQDFSSYWQQAQIYWGTGRTSYTSFKRTVGLGATQLYAGKKKVNTTNKLIKLLRAAPSTNPTLPGLLGGIVNLLESTTGVYDNTASRRYRGVNDFMSQAELRLHLTRMIGASPKDDTSAVFLNSRAFRTYLRRLGSQVKRTSSYMQLVQVFLSRCYHRWTSIPAPPYRSAGTKVYTKLVVPSGIKYKGSDKASKLYKQIYDTNKILERDIRAGGRAAKLREKNQNRSQDADPLRFREEVPTPDQKNKATEVHKKVAKNVIDAGFVSNTKSELRDFGRQLREEVFSKTRKVSPSQRSAARKRATGFADGLETAAKALPLLDRALNPNGPSNDPYWNYTQSTVVDARRYLDVALEKMAKAMKKPVRTIRRLITLDERLHMFLFTPDIFMVPPPKCNVLFPDQYTSVTFARSWMSEITRLILHTTTLYGRDRKDIYFSPNTSILNGPTAKMAEEMVKKSTSFLMTHEIYSGIIPSIEAIGDAALFKKLHKRAVQDAKKLGLAREKTSGQAAHSPQEHLARTTNFMFFSKRLAGRTMRVSCRYSPQLVPGLPCLVLDPHYGAEAAGLDWHGTHYVGTIARIHHVLNAHSEGGGQTVIDLVKCRAHNEGVDIFGDTRDGSATQEKTYTTSRRKKVPPINTSKVVGKDKEGKNVYDARYGVGQSGVGPAPVDVQATSAIQQSRNSDYLQRTQAHPAGSLGYFVKHTTTNQEKNPKLGKAPEAQGTVDDVVNFKKDPNKKYVIKTRVDYPGEAVEPGKSRSWTDEAGPATRHYRTFQVTAADRTPDPTQRYADPDVYLYVDIYEIQKRRKRINVSFDFESTATPAWFSPIYRSDRIGNDYYKYMIGCDSVLDGTGLTVPDVEENDVVVLEISKSIGGRVIKEEIGVPSKIFIKPENTAQAAERLGKTWHTLKDSGADVDLFISTYTDRSYATMVDIMGNQNPALKILADSVFTGGTEPIVGFHGNAYGPYEGFQDWLGQPLEFEPLYRLAKKGEFRTLDKKADPRFERYWRVANYVSELRTLGKRGAGLAKDSGGSSAQRRDDSVIEQ